MADTVYTVETISLQDEDSTEVVLKPLVISAMKRFMKKREQLAEANKKKVDEDNDANPYELGFDMMVQLAGVCLEKQLKGEKTAKQYTEFLEDSLDFDTANYVIEKMTGITFTNVDVDEDTPKAREAGIV